MRASKALLIGAICIGLLLTTTITQAAVVYDTFYVELSANNVVNRSNSGGTGFNNGEWFEYTDPAGGPNWWNQWFFNNRDIAGSKWIEWKIFPEGDPNSVSSWLLIIAAGIGLIRPNPRSPI
ncbi:MAG: hypothetical protein GY699_01885 [Desulfobacteraceae bacterium]|nr:hypothetical protein [Desulfobacteraceae bacterium]